MTRDVICWVVLFENGLAAEAMRSFSSDDDPNKSNIAEAAARWPWDQFERTYYLTHSTPHVIITSPGNTPDMWVIVKATNLLAAIVTASGVLGHSTDPQGFTFIQKEG